MGTFGRGAVKDILRKAGMSDVYRLAPESVAVMALSFHPELSSDLRLHEEFLRLVRGRKEETAA